MKSYLAFTYMHSNMTSVLSLWHTIFSKFWLACWMWSIILMPASSGEEFSTNLLQSCHGKTWSTGYRKSQTLFSSNWKKHSSFLLSSYPPNICQLILTIWTPQETMQIHYLVVTLNLLACHHALILSSMFPFTLLYRFFGVNMKYISTWSWLLSTKTFFRIMMDSSSNVKLSILNFWITVIPSITHDAANRNVPSDDTFFSKCYWQSGFTYLYFS